MAISGKFTRTSKLVLVAAMVFTLSACATATRGNSTLFIVETTPVGAKVETTVPVKGTRKMSNFRLNKIKSGELPEPEYEYRFCEPTPCGVEVPRKTNFHVLVTKEGYQSHVQAVGFLHRKEIAKETKRNTALAAGATGVAGGTFGVAAVTSLGTAGTMSVGGAAATGAAIFAAPVLVVGAVSMGVDASSGANYDVWPNPLPLALMSEDKSIEAHSQTSTVLSEFKTMQRKQAMAPSLTAPERAKEKSRLREEKKAERNRERAEKKAAREAEKSNARPPESKS